MLTDTNLSQGLVPNIVIDSNCLELLEDKGRRTLGVILSYIEATELGIL